MGECVATARCEAVDLRRRDETSIAVSGENGWRLAPWSDAQRFLNRSLPFSWLEGSFRITGVADLDHSDGKSPVKCRVPLSSFASAESNRAVLVVSQPGGLDGEEERKGHLRQVPDGIVRG